MQRGEKCARRAGGLSEIDRSIPRSRARLSLFRRGDTTERFPFPDFIFNLPAAPRQSVRKEKKKRGGDEVERKITGREAAVARRHAALSESFRPSSAINVIARTAVIKPQQCRGSFPRAKVNGIKTQRRAGDHFRWPEIVSPLESSGVTSAIPTCRNISRRCFARSSFVPRRNALTFLRVHGALTVVIRAPCKLIVKPPSREGFP